MSVLSVLRRLGLAGLVVLFAVIPADGQSLPRDYTVHDSPLLTFATPGAPIQIQPTGDRRAASVRLTTRGRQELRLVADSFTVTMGKGGFTLSGTGSVVLSGAYSLKAQAITLTVCSDGRSVLEVRQGVREDR